MGRPPVFTGIRRRAMSWAVAGRTARPATADHVFSVVVLIVMVTATSVRTSTFQMPQTLLWVSMLVIWLPVALRTYAPTVALAAAVLAESIYLVALTDVDPHLVGEGSMGALQPVPVASAALAYTVASRTPRRIGWSAGLCAAAVLFVVSYLSHTPRLLATDMVTVNVVVLATGIGIAVGTRRDRIAADAVQRQEDTRQAVLDERLRIARELHDVLAHNLTLVNAQASVARYLLRTDPSRAVTALGDITTHTARAIDELRATVGLLRGDDEGASDPEALRPVPGMDRLDELLGSFRTAGAEISLTIHGDARELDRQADLAAYRITQEALTNATKHAPHASIDLQLHWSPTGLEIHVRNPLASRSELVRPAPGTGHGVIGMRERAVTAGGRLDARPTPDGLYDVDAWLPAAGLAAGRSRVEDEPTVTRTPAAVEERR